MIYTFPFDQCLTLDTAHVYIFGAGKVGNEYQNQIDAQNRVINKGFIDNHVTLNSARYESIRRIGVYKPDVLQSAVYDYIILACSYKLIPELCECLFNIGVDQRKILIGKPSNIYFTPNIGTEWNDYYDSVERSASLRVEQFFAPALSKHDISILQVLDFPCGRGRIAEVLYKKYKKEIKKFVCVDANVEAVEHCKKRFSSNDIFEYLVNNVDGFHCYPLDIPDKSFSFIYSFDAMVHFSYTWIDFYLGEFYRLLNSNGFAFIHHSNLGSANVKIDASKSECWSENPGGRSLISYDDVKRISLRCGFEIVEQTIIDWNISKLDCITILRKL